MIAQKPTPQIKYHSTGTWQDLTRAEAVRMIRESRLEYACDRLFPHEYILHEEYGNAVFVRTNSGT